MTLAKVKNLVTRIDLHIIRRLLVSYLLFVGALIVFFIVLHYVEYIDDFMDRGATMGQVFLVYYPSYIPEIIRLISPLALFLACLYLTGKLAQELQLAALQTSGVSLYRLLAPYVLVGIVITGFIFWFNGWVVPDTNRIVYNFEQQYLKDAPRRINISRIHRQNQPRQIVTVGYYDAEDTTAHRISLQLFTEERRLVSRIDARQMTWLDSLQQWRVEEPVIRRFTESGLIERRQKGGSTDTTLRLLPRDLARTTSDVATMDINQAADYVASLRRTGADHLGRPLMAYFSKYTYPLANLILVLIAVPLAAVRRRGGMARRFGVGLGIAFLYLAIQKLIEPFGYTGLLPPIIASWLPHAAFAVVAAVLLWRVRK